MKKRLVKIEFIFLILMLFINTINIYAMNTSSNYMIAVDPPGLYVWSPFLYSISPIVFKSIVALGKISLIFMLISLVKHNDMKFTLIYIAMYIISAITLKIAKTESVGIIHISKLKYIILLAISIILRIVMIVYPIRKIVKQPHIEQRKN